MSPLWIKWGAGLLVVLITILFLRFKIYKRVIALEKSEKKYRDIFENALVGIFQSSLEGRFLRVNHAMAKIYGYETPEKMISEITDISKQLYVNKSGREIFLDDLKSNHGVLITLNQNYCRDGSIIWISTKAREVCDENRQVLYIEGFLEDVTKQVQIEEKLQKHTQQLEAQNTITTALSASLNLEELLEIILKEVALFIKFDSASIFLTEKDGQMTIAKAVGDAERFTGHSVPYEDTFLQNTGIDGKPLILDDVRQSSDFKKWDDAPLICGWMGLSLVAHDIVLGYLTFDSHESRAFSPQDAALAQSFSHHIAQVLYNARLHKKIQQNLQRLETLNETIGALSTSLDLDTLLDLILEKIKGVLPLDSGAIFLYEGDKLRVAADFGISPSVKGHIFPGESELLKKIKLTQSPLVLDNACEDPRFQNWGKTANVINWMGVPLLVRDEIIGYLTLDSHNINVSYSAEHADLVKPFAAQAAQALYNARLHKRVIQDSNELEKRVRKRTVELQSFVELAAGREIRMAELKHVIAELRTQLTEAGQVPTTNDPLHQS